ncbi:MAG: hypothetical protein OEL84_01665 [Nitrosopumilus sp.]|nr:hypothetical protein [Nitrosopumilus sp.]
MIIQDHYTQQCFVVAEFFPAWSRCFDRSSVIHSSSTELQDVVDKTRKTEKEMGLSHYDDFGEHQYDRELSSSLLSYLVVDTVDRVDLGSIKGGSFPVA